MVVFVTPKMEETRKCEQQSSGKKYNFYIEKKMEFIRNIDVIESRKKKCVYVLIIDWDMGDQRAICEGFFFTRLRWSSDFHVG